jgi:hypothetical protein
MIVNINGSIIEVIMKLKLILIVIITKIIIINIMIIIHKIIISYIYSKLLIEVLTASR